MMNDNTLTVVDTTHLFNLLGSLMAKLVEVGVIDRVDCIDVELRALASSDASAAEGSTEAPSSGG